MKRLGVAISVYNKVNELQTNVNIIRNHWPANDVYISVCCNDPSSYNEIAKMDIDYIAEGHDYKKDPKTHREHEKNWKRLRTYDTIKKSVLGCIDQSEYIAHWHADAYALDMNKIYEMLDVMAANGYKVAFRGKFRGLINNKMPYGHIDDHFSIYSSEHVKKTHLFNESKKQISAVKSVSGLWNSEGILSALIQSATYPKQIWHYDDMSKNIVHPDAPVNKKPHDPLGDDWYPDGIAHSVLPPYNFDPVRKFLHSDTIEYTRRFFKECNIPLDLISTTSNLDE